MFGNKIILVSNEDVIIVYYLIWTFVYVQRD